MRKKKPLFIRGNMKYAFRTDESIFRLKTAIKVTAIFLITTLGTLFFFSQMLDYGYLFMNLSDLSGLGEIKSAYYNYIIKDAIKFIPIYVMSVITIFFLGWYLAGWILRPFNILMQYMESESPIIKKSNFLKVDLLDQVGTQFFQYVQMCRKEKKILAAWIPENFKVIHRPVWDMAFFLHLFFIFVGISIINGIFLQFISMEIHEKMLALTLEFLQDYKVASNFINVQSNLFLTFVKLGIGVSTCLYLILAFHLYGSISGAAFGFFATFRSFMKGDYKARVHLIGYPYIRPCSRKVNKYLESVEAEFKGYKKKNSVKQSTSENNVHKIRSS